MNKELTIIKSLVGESVTEENLKHIDSFVSSKVALFIPIGGNCGYAITPDHEHPSYMFVISYDCENEVFLNNKSIKSYPNSIFCLSPNIKHHEIQNYLPPKYCAVFIEKHFFEESILNYTDTQPYFNGLIVDIKSSKIERHIREFIDEALSAHVVLDTIAILLTHEIIRTLIDYDTKAPILSDNLVINEAVKFVNTHFEKEINIETLAKLSYLSKSHFSKIFTQEMKMTPMLYLKRIRLQNAKKMLLTDSFSITEVSMKCGFNSTSYFIKLFKEEFNLTPKEFMRSVSL